MINQLYFSTRAQISNVIDIPTRLNAIAEQTLTIEGINGSVTLNIDQNEDANTLARNINELSTQTGVNADAVTVLVLKKFNIDSTISFALQGENSLPILISAQVFTQDLTKLAEQLNKFAENTGVAATVTHSKDQIILRSLYGHNITIANFSADNPDCQMQVGAFLDEDEDEDVILGTGQKSIIVSGCITFESHLSFVIQSNITGKGALIKREIFTIAPRSS